MACAPHHRPVSVAFVSMADISTPRTAGPETNVLPSTLRYLRESLIRKAEGLDEQSARWSPVASGTSILWLIDHMAFVEDIWFVNRFLGESEIGPFALSDSLPAAIENYRAVGRRVDAIIDDTTDLDTPSRGDVGGDPVSMRWILTHLIGESARHAGHADIIREMIDETTGR
ncbi:MAG: DinB family protein [Actinobacteria bacterium]|nr:DinB family protein [Actinomycetota bacterium]